MFIKPHVYLKLISRASFRNSLLQHCCSITHHSIGGIQSCKFSIHKEHPVHFTSTYSINAEDQHGPQTFTTLISSLPENEVVNIAPNTKDALIEEASSGIDPSTSSLPASDQTELGSERSTLKVGGKKPKKKNQLHIPSWFNRDKYEMTTSVSSIVYTFKEIACVTMNKNYEVTNIQTRKFSKNFRAAAYWEIVNSLVENIPSDSLCLVEHIALPAKFHQVNLHQRTLQMLLFGMLQTKEDKNKIVMFSRKAVGNMFNLNIKKALNRMDSQMLVKDIISTQNWGDIDLNISSSFFRVKNDKLYFSENMEDDLITRICMQEVSDALLQAIAFWSIANEQFDGRTKLINR